jgi:hypothetical protein
VLALGEHRDVVAGVLERDELGGAGQIEEAAKWEAVLFRLLRDWAWSGFILFHDKGYDELRRLVGWIDGYMNLAGFDVERFARLVRRFGAPIVFEIQRSFQNIPYQRAGMGVLASCAPGANSTASTTVWKPGGASSLIRALRWISGYWAYAAAATSSNVSNQ